MEIDVAEIGPVLKNDRTETEAKISQSLFKRFNRRRMFEQQRIMVLYIWD